jgi:hypothetical protein
MNHELAFKAFQKMILTLTLISREERRRTFWIAFCQDRYASIGTGWPMTIDEKDVNPYYLLDSSLGLFTHKPADFDDSAFFRRRIFEEQA